ncbi:hypothetical protein Ancab_016739 [Ancistrocladus abbreviatus]
MGNWLIRERRGPEWKKGWTERTITSISPPPMPLIALFAIVVFYIYLSSYFAYKAEVERTVVSLRIILFLLPVLLIFIMRSCRTSDGRLVVQIPRPEHDSIHRVGSSPWGVLVVLVVILALLSFQPSFRAKWFRPICSCFTIVDIIVDLFMFASLPLVKVAVSRVGL